MEDKDLLLSHCNILHSSIGLVLPATPGVHLGVPQHPLAQVLHLQEDPLVSLDIFLSNNGFNIFLVYLLFQDIYRGFL